MTDAVLPAKPEAEEGKVLSISGSDSARFRVALLNDVLGCIVPPGTDEKIKMERLGAAMDALAGFAPKNEVEGMLAAQAVSMNAAAMMALRQAMAPGLPFEVADKLRRRQRSCLRLSLIWSRPLSAVATTEQRGRSSASNASSCRTAVRPLSAPSRLVLLPPGGASDALPVDEPLGPWSAAQKRSPTRQSERRTSMWCKDTTDRNAMPSSCNARQASLLGTWRQILRPIRRRTCADRRMQDEARRPVRSDARTDAKLAEAVGRSEGNTQWGRGLLIG
jgi:hypothetical protein